MLAHMTQTLLSLLGRRFMTCRDPPQHRVRRLQRGEERPPLTHDLVCRGPIVLPRQRW